MLFVAFVTCELISRIKYEFNTAFSLVSLRQADEVERCEGGGGCKDITIKCCLFSENGSQHFSIEYMFN